MTDEPHIIFGRHLSRKNLVVDFTPKKGKGERGRSMIEVGRNGQKDGRTSDAGSQLRTGEQGHKTPDHTHAHPTHSHTNRNSLLKAAHADCKKL